MKIGRKIYFELSTGNVIIDTGQRRGSVIPTTFEQDWLSYSELQERVPSTVGLIELEYGQYSQDFSECIGYHVDIETDKLVFSYPDPNEPEIEQSYQAPLSVQIEELKQENELLKARDKALSERADFVEDLIAEMAIQVYQ